MARLQILWLPPVEKADGARETPFALVVDQCELSRPFRHIVGAPPFEVRSFGLVQAMVDTPPAEVTEFESEQDRWSRFAEQIGARGAFVTYEQVDFVEQNGTDAAGAFVTADRIDLVESDDGDPEPAKESETHYWHVTPLTVNPGTHAEFLRRWLATTARMRQDGGRA